MHGPSRVLAYAKASGDVEETEREMVQLLFSVTGQGVHIMRHLKLCQTIYVDYRKI